MIDTNNRELIERRLLSSIIVSNDREKTYRSVAGFINQNFFSTKSSYLVMRFLKNNVLDIEKVTALQLVDYLSSNGVEESVEYLAGLSELEVTDKNAEFFAKKLRELAYKDKLREIAESDGDSREKVEQLNAELEALQGYQADYTPKEVAMNYIENITNPPKKIQLINGIDSKRGEMVVIAARPAVGKSGVALNIFNNLVNKKIKCAYFSLEMNANQVFNRLMTMETETRDSEILMKQAMLYAENDFAIIDNVNSNIEDVIAQIHQLSKQDYDVFFVDYLSLLSAKGVSRYEQVSTISRRLKQTALRENIVIVALAQLNRQASGRQDKRPKITDLRDSGQIEQDGDKIILLHSDDYDDEVVPDTVNLDMILAKNREGNTGTITVDYDRPIQKIRERKW